MTYAFLFAVLSIPIACVIAIRLQRKYRREKEQEAFERTLKERQHRIELQKKKDAARYEAERQARKQKEDRERQLKENRERILRIVDNDFKKMPGWDFWDETIHQLPGQYERIGNRLQLTDADLLVYDSRYELAQIRGSQGIIYVVGPRSCNCEDFYWRSLPCKHMYFLANQLNGAPDKSIGQLTDASLRHVTVLLAGRFSKGKDDKANIRTKISDLGGVWTNSINRNVGIMVCGKDPSFDKTEYAKRHGLPVLQEEDILSIFRKTDVA